MSRDRPSRADVRDLASQIALAAAALAYVTDSGVRWREFVAFAEPGDVTGFISRDEATATAARLVGISRGATAFDPEAGT